MNAVRGILGIAAVAALALPPVPAVARSASVPAPATPPAAGYVMPQTQVWDMASDSGDIYRIFVSYPKTPAPPGGYPVLYVIDGNAHFAQFAQTRLLTEYYDMGKAIVVGVGYPGDEAFSSRRSADFLYPVPDYDGKTIKYLRPASSARDKFLDFLTGKLRTEIGKRYKIDLDRQSLFGHSFGGLFALHTLYTRPDAFQSIVAASPSIVWNTQDMLKEERAFVEGLKSGKTQKMARLMVLVGDRDTDDDPEPARALAARLDPLSAYGLSTRYYKYDLEIHMTVPARSVTDVLRFVTR